MLTKLLTPFLLSLFALLIIPALYPSFHLLFFSPYLVLVIYRRRLLTAFWHATACGVLMDFLSTTPQFGFTPLVLCTTVFACRRLSRHFFEDQFLTLSLMTFFFSFIYTIFEGFFRFFFGQPLPLSAEWFFSDLFIMPLFDAIAAFCLYVIPFHLSRKLSKLKLYDSVRKKDRRRSGRGT